MLSEVIMHESIKDRPMIGIGIVVTRNDKILLGSRLAGHGAGMYQIPGGHLEFGETFEETAIREVLEEAGLPNIIVKGVVSVSNDRQFNKHYVSIGILAESFDGEPYNAEPDKSENWGWHDPHNLPQPMFPHSAKVIENWLARSVYSL